MKEHHYRRVIFSIHNTNHTEKVGDSKLKKFRGAWNDITKIGVLGPKFNATIKEGIKHRVGNGAHTKFWEDMWIREAKLKDVFPILFTISLQQEEPIQKIGFCDGLQWHWSFSWRRTLFQLENQQLSQLMLLLQDVQLASKSNDSLWWNLCSKGRYTVSFFTKEIWRKKIKCEWAIYIKYYKGVWQGLVPHKIELHAWFVLLGKINTLDRLKRFSVISPQEAACPFASVDESINHCS